VFGAGQVAETGQLLVAFSGPDAAFEAASPYFKGVIGRDVLRVASEPDKGTLLKTCG
jgi:3-hydroxyisobutyrate dehydrogenase-like beta-hydroxyacid dehydrogenase